VTAGALRVAGFACLVAAGWLVAPVVGLLAAAGSCWALERVWEAGRKA